MHLEMMKIGNFDAFADCGVSNVKSEKRKECVLAFIRKMSPNLEVSLLVLLCFVRIRSYASLAFSPRYSH